jgi:hypothetical protein
VDVTVTQAPAVQLVLSVTPSNQAVSKDAGTTTFNVSNTGTGTMPWTAAVTSGGAWLKLYREPIPERSHAVSQLIPAHPRVPEFGLRHLAQRAAPRMSR